MTPPVLLHLSPFLLSGVLTLTIGLYCVFRKDVPGAWAFGVASLAKTAMIAGFVIETAAVDLRAKILWDHLQYLPMFLAPMATLVFVYQFVGKEVRRPLSSGAALLAFPVAFLAILFTGVAPGWIESGYHLKAAGPYTVLGYSFGPLLVLAAGYIYIVLAIGVLALVSHYRRVPRHYRTQIRVVLVGVAIPVVGSVFTLLDVSPLVHRDLAPVTFGLSSGVVAWGLFRHKLFRRSLIEFEQIWHDLTEGIIVVDGDGTVVALNPAASSLLDQSQGLVLGASIHEVWRGSYPQIHKALMDHQATGQNVSGDFANGTRYLQMGIRSLVGASGAPLGTVIQIHDETREKVLQDRLRARASDSELSARYAEERLHENQEQLEMALAGAELGTWDWRVVTGEFTFNGRCLEMLGLAPGQLELRIESWERRMHPEDQPRARKLLVDHLEGQTPVYEAEYRIQHANGSWVWVLSLGKVISRDSAGQPVRLCGTHLDVTARHEAVALQKELAEKLQRAERMESLGLLAGGVAHDLNNLLAPVVGYSQMLLRELEGKPDLAKRLSRIERAGKDAAELVQDLLALARRGRYEMKPVDVNRLIVDLLESPAVEKFRQRQPGVMVARKFPPAAAVVAGSEVHLKKAFLNLVVNAFDAMAQADTGTITVTVEPIQLTELERGPSKVEPGPYVKVSVRDTGQGIAPEDRKRIFEPYFSKKAMTGSSGSGLGLSVVYGVLKDHGGYYDLVSEVGKGSEFVLYFPATEAPTPAPTVDVDAPRGSGTVLVVDDVQEQRELARDMIGSLGYQVFTVESGYEAVAFVQSRKVDIVVLDMILGDGIDGLDTYRQLRKTEPRQKALIVSGFSATERVEEACRLGVGGFLKKPYTLEQIANSLRRALDRKIALAPDHAPAAPPVVI